MTASEIQIKNAIKTLNEKIDNLKFNTLSDYESHGIYNKTMDVVDYMNYVESKHPKDLVKSKR